MKINAKILWHRSPEEKFLDGNYRRVHNWILDGGMRIEASSSPEIIPMPMSDPSLIDPEEAFIASIASCHMLFFLSIAAKKKFIIENYEDNPEAIMGNNNEGKMAILSLILQPKVTFAGTNIPAEDNIKLIHELAHSNCFLANSIRTKISIII
jgi:organic hydroperoxide reductase OsmC/OhrA